MELPLLGGLKCFSNELIHYLFTKHGRITRERPENLLLSFHVSFFYKNKQQKNPEISNSFLTAIVKNCSKAGVSEDEYFPFFVCLFLL